MNACPTCGRPDPLDAASPGDCCSCGFIPNEPLARQIVSARGGGLCELCHQRSATEWAHRIARSGGGYWIPSNGLHLCNRCHAWTHHEPFLAERGGWRIESSGEHPATVPVWIQPWLGPGWYLLDDAGCYDRLWERTDAPTLPPWIGATAAIRSRP